MLFIDKNKKVELTIVGYEYPDAPISDIENSKERYRGDFDRNWLLIYINVKSKISNWEKTDPALLTWDISRLIEWFIDLSENKADENEIDFVEYCISFKYIPKSENRIIKYFFKRQKKTIRVILNLEQLFPQGPDEHDLHFDFEFSNAQVKKIASEFQAEYDKFPAR